MSEITFVAVDEFPRLVENSERCPVCQSRPGQPCTDYAPSKNGLDMVPFMLDQPHHERQEALVARWLHSKKPIRLMPKGQPKEPFQQQRPKRHLLEGF